MSKSVGSLLNCTHLLWGVLFAALFALPQEAQAGQRSQQFKILSRHVDKCLDLHKRRARSGNKIHMWSCKRDITVKKNRLWVMEKTGGGYFMIRSAKNMGLCLDPGGSYSRLNHCHGRPWQLFKLDRKDNGYWRFRSKEKPGKCLDVHGASKKNGAKLTLYRCHGGHNQQFKFYVPNSHKMNRFISNLAKDVGKGVKKASQATINAAKKAAKEVAKGSKAALRKTKEAWKKMGQAIKDKAIKAMKAAIDKAVGEIKGKLENEVKKAANKIKREVENKAKKVISDVKKKRGLFGRIRRMSKSQLRSKMGKLRKKFSPKQLLKKAKKSGGGIKAKLASVGVDLVYAIGWAAAECGMRAEDVAKEGNYQNCFANKAQEGIFDIFWGLITGVAMEVAEKTVLLPPIGVCVSVVAAAIPGVGLGLSYGCVIGVNAAATDIIDNKLKNPLRGKIWGDKNRKLGKVFYKLFGGGKARRGGSASTNRRGNRLVVKLRHDFAGPNLKFVDGTSHRKCQELCRRNRKCHGYSWLNQKRFNVKRGRCHLKSKITSRSRFKYHHSGEFK